MNPKRYLSWIVLAFLIALPNALQAQSTNGNIIGTVTDSNGAVLPNVSIKITNTATNAVRTVMSDSAGNYTAQNLSIGGYQISAELSGFKRAVLSPIN